MLVNSIIDMQKSPKCSFVLTIKIVSGRMQHCLPTSCKNPTLVKQCSCSPTAGKNISLSQSTRKVLPTPLLPSVGPQTRAFHNIYFHAVFATTA